MNRRVRLMFSATIVTALWVAASAISSTGNDGAPNSRTGATKKRADSASAADSDRKAARKDDASAVTPAREAAALTFARRHHAELAELLPYLKRSNPAEYQRAIRELFETSERLARIKTRFPERYELELRAWTLDSRIRLLGAKLAMGGDAGVETELKQALRERLDVKLQLLAADRDRIEKRLERLNRTIEELQRTRDEVVEKDFERLMKRLRGVPVKATRRTPKRAGPAKDAAEPKKGSNKSTQKRVEN